MDYFRLFAVIAIAIAAAGSQPARGDYAAIPDDFPCYRVPGHEHEMASLRSLFWLHYQSTQPLAPLWDEWLINATIWPARGQGDNLLAMRRTWAATLAGRSINAEGYVHTHQHDGPAHAEGWPFPTWMQAGGIGWHFRPIGIPGYEAPPATSDGWTLTGATGAPLNARGWPIELTQADATLQSPAFGYDALATVYYYDALLDLARLESAIAEHPELLVPRVGAYDPADLRQHAAEVKQAFGERFWNPETGRFGTMDLDRHLHDYGFTFLNNEAVVFGLATPEQQKSIHTWMAGTRAVAGDISTSTDIYHWRFGPRSSTRRNIDYYFWGWSAPESIPWGGQVQDGGAVLGWTHYDLMARLRSAGPENAAARLQAIATWFDEVQAAGGYRAYYGKDASRGTLQGGGTAGGLGLDSEFFESVLATQVMLYGFLGFEPTIDGFVIAPQLPRDWPELTVSRIHIHGHVLDITATRDGEIRIVGAGPSDEIITIEAPPGVRLGTTNGIQARLVPRKPQ